MCMCVYVCASCYLVSSHLHTHPSIVQRTNAFDHRGVRDFTRYISQMGGIENCTRAGMGGEGVCSVCGVKFVVCVREDTHSCSCVYSFSRSHLYAACMHIVSYTHTHTLTYTHTDLKAQAHTSGLEDVDIDVLLKSLGLELDEGSDDDDDEFGEDDDYDEGLL
jgi:hypothetical protein